MRRLAATHIALAFQTGIDNLLSSGSALLLGEGALEQFAFFLAMRPQVVKTALKIGTNLPELRGIVLGHMVQSHYDSVQPGM
jgi:hypothetical protein